jgi:hypothetical protein
MKDEVREGKWIGISERKTRKRERKTYGKEEGCHNTGLGIQLQLGPKLPSC